MRKRMEFTEYLAALRKRRNTQRSLPVVIVALTGLLVCLCFLWAELWF